MRLDAWSDLSCDARFDAVASRGNRYAGSAPLPLAQLGPVLLVRPPAAGARSCCRLRICIDSDGVRECLDLGELRLFRLPDSDYLGWERLGVPCVPDASPRRALPLRRARASLAQAGVEGWQPVRRLSALGWDVAQRILQREAATLCVAAWRD